MLGGERGSPQDEDDGDGGEHRSQHHPQKPGEPVHGLPSWLEELDLHGWRVQAVCHDRMLLKSRFMCVILAVVRIWWFAVVANS
jgi:hypothetical protein